MKKCGKVEILLWYLRWWNLVFTKFPVKNYTTTSIRIAENVSFNILLKFSDSETSLMKSNKYVTNLNVVKV